MKWTVDMVGDVYKEIIEYEGLGVDICRRINYQAIADKLNAPKLNEAQRLWGANRGDLSCDNYSNGFVQSFLSTLNVVPEKATEEMASCVAIAADGTNREVAQALLDYLRGVK